MEVPLWVELGLKRICSCSEASALGAVEFAIDQRSSSLMSGMAVMRGSSMGKEIRQEDEDDFILESAAANPPTAELVGGGGRRCAFSQTLE